MGKGIVRNVLSAKKTPIKIKQVTTTGQTRSLYVNSYNAIYNTTTIALLTLTMPANPKLNDFVEIKFSNPITSLSITSSNTIITPITSALTGGYVKYVYDGINNWF